jgi:hypothetical protein
MSLEIIITILEPKLYPIDSLYLFQNRSLIIYDLSHQAYHAYLLSFASIY